MRGAGIAEFGGLVEILELPEPAGLEPDAVLIEVYASGVANLDDIVWAGNWDMGASPPMSLGVEAAGVVRSATCQWPCEKSGVSVVRQRRR
jgi:NADPH:quinone reductase-like Zn-dependent oxidoreductase